jgi:hypothetical protein
MGIAKCWKMLELFIDLHKMQDPRYRPRLGDVELLIDWHKMLLEAHLGAT